MSTELVVHIGLPKTGSTSIQGMLYELQPLLMRSGFWIPTAGRLHPRRCSHNNVALSLSGDDNYRPELGGWTELRHEITSSNARKILISSEMFSLRREVRAIERLTDLIKSENLAIKVVAYVRPQYQLLESRYSERIRGMGTATFDEFMGEMLNSDRMDFNAIFGPWREAFGSRLAVYPMEPSRLPQGLLVHFLGVLGIALHGVDVTTHLHRENQRRGAKDLEVQRLVNIGTSGLGQRERRLRRDRLQFLPALLSPDAPFVGLSVDQIHGITRYYADSNAKFARDFGIDDNGVLFRDPLNHRPEPNCARWADTSRKERRMVCRYVRDVAGVDVGKLAEGGLARAGPPEPLPPSSSLKAWWVNPRVFKFKARMVMARRIEDPLYRLLRLRRIRRLLSREVSTRLDA